MISTNVIARSAATKQPANGLTSPSRVCFASLAMTLVLISCAANAPQPPYPVFIQVEELPDTFIAGLPGVRAKQLAGNLETGASSYQLLLPADW